MKIVAKVFAVTALMATVLIIGCNSSADKVEDARDKVKDEEKDVVDAKADLQQAQNDSIAEYARDKAVWVALLDANDLELANYKAKLNNQSRADRELNKKRIADLETKNKAMRLKLDEQQAKGTRWQAFKREFNHDMDEMGTAFKDLGTNNTK